LYNRIPSGLQWVGWLLIELDYSSLFGFQLPFPQPVSAAHKSVGCSFRALADVPSSVWRGWNSVAFLECGVLQAGIDLKIVDAAIMCAFFFGGGGGAFPTEMCKNARLSFRHVFACKNSRTAERIFVKFDIKEVY
jgi:hypothetical protein